jgi:DNA polymerase
MDETLAAPDRPARAPEPVRTSPRRITLRPGADREGFRRAVRTLIAAEMAPQHVVFAAADAPDLFGRDGTSAAPPVPLPRSVAELIGVVVCHRDPERYALLYRLVWRVLNGERELLSSASDALVHRLETMARAVRRDLDGMHASVRFRRTGEGGRERFVAWYEPEHFILEAAAEVFVGRFRAHAFSILTPIGSLHWDGERLAGGPPARREDAPDGDAFAEGRRSDRDGGFDPARLRPGVSQPEMPNRNRPSLPPAAAPAALVQTAPQRVVHTIEQEAAMPAKRTADAAPDAMWEREPKSLAELNEIIRAAGPLVPGATQAVLGEGPEHADIAFVGEQPGDQEDLQGRPFVGPAGKLLTRAMGEVGLSREQAYLTNAVKHFKFELRGKRRIHSKPTAGEVKHYRPWLMKELELVRPRVVVALGGTAVLALTGKQSSIIRARGRAQFGPFQGYVTVHPSYLLRLPDEASKQRGYEEFLADLARIRDLARADPHTGELAFAAE